MLIVLKKYYKFITIIVIQFLKIFKYSRLKKSHLNLNLSDYLSAKIGSINFSQQKLSLQDQFLVVFKSDSK